MTQTRTRHAPGGAEQLVYLAICLFGIPALFGWMPLWAEVVWCAVAAVAWLRASRRPYAVPASELTR